MGIFDQMKRRGLISQVTDEALKSVLDSSKVSAYIGFDPTADSLHVGHLVQIFNLRRLQEYGHRPIAVAGGGTGMIGDPSGKSEERILLDQQRLDDNLEKIRMQLQKFLDFGEVSNKALLLNNADWLSSLSLVDFLREVGKHFSVNQMVAKDSVRSRLLEREQGISYTEFSYMLLQAYDFLHLYDNYDCLLQMGASDQWGNITAGIELIRKKRRKAAYGLTTPLVLKADGTKFGKSESGTVWLDAEKTSPYQFYQYFLRVEDEMVGGYLRSFTWLTDDELEDLDLLTKEKAKERRAQKVLAFEITRLVHGPEMAENVKRASEVLFSEDIMSLSGELLDIAIADAPSYQIPSLVISEGVPIVDLLIEAGLAKSKSEARKVVDQGGAYINNIRVTDQAALVSSSSLIDGRALLVRRGKKDYAVVRAS